MSRIGVFDSGVGGLTVLAHLVRAYPQHEYFYLGDTARLPYGSKSPQTIRTYSEQLLNLLVDQGADQLLIACNTASAQIRTDSWQGVPLANSIDPCVEAARQLSLQHSTSDPFRVGVIATSASIASKVYQKALQEKIPLAEVQSQACPLFVPLVEEGWISDPITNLIAYRYLQQFKSSAIHALILGCTHYPALTEAITRVVGQDVFLLDTGTALVQQGFGATNEPKANQARESEVNASTENRVDDFAPNVRISFSDDSPRTRQIAQQMMGDQDLTFLPWPQ